LREVDLMDEFDEELQEALLGGRRKTSSSRRALSRSG